MPLDIHISSIDKAQILKIQAKLKWYNTIDNKVNAIINTPCTNKTVALELIYDIYNGNNIQMIVDKMNILLRAIRIDQRHDFDDDGNRCTGDIDVNFIPFSLGSIADELRNRYINPPNSKVEVISSQTELTGLKYYCMDIGVRDGNAKILEETIEKTLNDEIKLNNSMCCSKISTIAQIIDSAGCAYNKENLNSYDAGTCTFCNNEMTMYNIGFIFYQGFFEYFSNKETFFIFEYLNDAGADITKKVALANMSDSTQKKVRLSLYERGKPTKLTSSSCTIGQKGFSVMGICTFLSNDKGMFDKSFVDYIKNTLAGSSGDKEVQKLFKTTTCMCVKGYGDFGQLILTSYLNCLQPYINNIILLTCDRFLAYIACILECPFMLGTTVDPCYLYDSSAKLLNKYIVDVWNMSAKNIKIICDPLHNDKVVPLLSHDINALITAQQNHINTERAQNSFVKNIEYIKKFSKLLKVDELIKQFKEEESRLYRRYCNDYVIIYNNKSGAPCYELYDISELLSIDVQAFFTNPIANIGKGKLILKDPGFLKSTTKSTTIITTEQYTSAPPFNSVNLLRKHIEATGRYNNIFIEIKVFTEGLVAKQLALHKYTGYEGSTDGFTTNLNIFAYHDQTGYTLKQMNWEVIGYGTKETLENEIKTADGYSKILQHGIDNIFKTKKTKDDPLGAFNKFLTNNYKKKNSCSNTLDSSELLLENFPSLCDYYINELNTIFTKLEYILHIYTHSTFEKNLAIWKDFFKKIADYYEAIKIGFNNLIVTFLTTVGEIATLTKPYYVLEYYVNLFDNPDITYITPSMFSSQSELQTKEASIRFALKELNLKNIRLILEFIENINKKYSFVVNDVKPLKDTLIGNIDNIVASAIKLGVYESAALKKGGKKDIVKPKQVVKPKKAAQAAHITPIRGGMLGREYITTYDTNLTELQDQITNSCCVTACCYNTSSNMVSTNSDDNEIDILRYNEYLKELQIILRYLYGTYKNAEEELTLWNVFCYYYYVKINNDINSQYSLLEIKKDISIWETFKRNYPIYQYIIEHHYFTNNKGLLYKYIRNEKIDPTAIEASGETRLIIQRYYKFIYLENSISYYIQAYNIFEREKVDELTKKLETIGGQSIIGNLYGMYDLEKMLERPLKKQSLFIKTENVATIQSLSTNSVVPYNIGAYDEHLLKDYVFYRRDQNLDEFINKLPDEQSNTFLKMCLLDVDNKKGILEYIKDVRLDRLIYAIETKGRFLAPHIIDKLSDNQFKEIIKTHLGYIDPPVIYHLRPGQLFEFLVSPSIDIAYVRYYMNYASVYAIEPIIQRNPQLIIKLPLSKFEAFIKQDVTYFPHLSDDQRVEFLIANRSYIVYAGEKDHPIGHYISVDLVLQFLYADPSCIQYLSLNNTGWFIINFQDVIETNNIYIKLLTDNQIIYIIRSLIIPYLPNSSTKYILKYMLPKYILKYIKKKLILIDEGYRTIFQEFTPEQLIYILEFTGKDKDKDTNKSLSNSSGSRSSSSNGKGNGKGTKANKLEKIALIDTQKTLLIGLLTPFTQFMILQTNSELIKYFTDTQIDSLIALNLITSEQVKMNFIKHSLKKGSLLSYLSNEKLIEYTNTEPRLYNLLTMPRLTFIYNEINKIKNNDVALLKLLYYLKAEYKGEFIYEHPEILIKYKTYIQYLSAVQIYYILKFNIKGKRSYYSDLGVNSDDGFLSVLNDEEYVKKGYEKCKIYIQYLTDEQITNIISKRWVMNIISTRTDIEIEEVGKYHDKYIHLLLEGITGEQTLNLRIFDPTHDPKKDSDYDEGKMPKHDPKYRDDPFYHPRKYINYIEALPEETRIYFIKNLKRNEKHKEQLRNIIKEFPELLIYCSGEQIQDCFKVIDIIRSPIAYEYLHKMDDEQIEAIIKYSSEYEVYINYMSSDQLYRFISNNNVGYIKRFSVDKQYEVIIKNPTNITHILPEQVPNILDKLKSHGKDTIAFIDYLSIEQLKYLFSKGSPYITDLGEKKIKKYQEKLLEYAITQIQKNPIYIYWEPEVLKDAYLKILKKSGSAGAAGATGSAGMIYDAILKYDRSYFHSLETYSLKPILKLKPAYIKYISLKDQLYFIDKNWMYLEYLSVSRLKQYLVRREETDVLDFLHNRSKHNNTFDLVRFILEDDCSYIGYVLRFNEEKTAKFLKKYPEMPTRAFFNMPAKYYSIDKNKEFDIFKNILAKIVRMRELLNNPIKPKLRIVRGVNMTGNVTYKNNSGEEVGIAHINGLRKEIFHFLSTFTSISNITAILRNLSDGDMREYIRMYPGYIHYLSEERLLDIIEKDPRYIKYLDVDDIPNEFFSDQKYTNYITAYQRLKYNKSQKGQSKSSAKSSGRSSSKSASKSSSKSSSKSASKSSAKSSGRSSSSPKMLYNPLPKPQSSSSL